MASSGNDASKNKQCFCLRLTEARKSAQLAMLAWKECDSKVFTGFKKPFKMWTGLLLSLLSFKRREYKQLIYGIKKEREKLWNVRWGEHVEQTNKNRHFNKQIKQKSLFFFLSLELNVRAGSVLFLHIFLTEWLSRFKKTTLSFWLLMLHFQTTDSDHRPEY